MIDVTAAVVNFILHAVTITLHFKGYE